MGMFKNLHKNLSIIRSFLSTFLNIHLKILPVFYMFGLVRAKPIFLCTKIQGGNSIERISKKLCLP